MYRRKWKPSRTKAQEFKNKMREIDEYCAENGITQSKNSDSYYFTHNGIEYRHMKRAKPAFCPFSHYITALIYHMKKEAVSCDTASFRSVILVGQFCHSHRSFI